MSLRASLSVLLLPLAFSLASPPVSARLDGSAWKEVQDQARHLFGTPGEREAKAALVARMVADGERRAWKLLVDSLEKEAELWVNEAVEAQKIALQVDAIQSKSMAQRHQDEQDLLESLRPKLLELEKQMHEQRMILQDMTRAMSDGPEDMRKNLFEAAQGRVPWTIRATAAQVAGAHPEERDAFTVLGRLIVDKDPRVRLAALEGLRRAGRPPEGEDEGTDATPPTAAEKAAREKASSIAEGLILGRLADSDWGVQLTAVDVVRDRGMKMAVPHLITALEHADPRLADAIVKVLREFTGQNFDPYADIWAKWWEEHKAEYQSTESVKAGHGERSESDAFFYGMPIKSNRVLFIIDISDSMKLKTVNQNPLEKWRKRGPVTGEGAPPPPPPPEEILSGPKIDVAKDELRKAIDKLPAATHFNIIAFNTAVFRWQDKMMLATKKNKVDALVWVKGLQPKGVTYIDGALRYAFELAGVAAMDKAYTDVNVDTMILLSDGAPTDDTFPRANLMDPEVILQHVREWNRYHKVVIDCVGVDMVESIEFMTKLAAQNGGYYLDR